MNKLPPGTIVILLEEVFGLKVKKHINTYSVKCPFHEDNKASALVVPELNIFTCLVCGEKLKERWAAITKKPFDKKPRKYYYIPAKAVAMLEGINKRGLTEKEWKSFLNEIKNRKEITKYQIQKSKYKNQKSPIISPEEVWNLSGNYICTDSMKYLKSRNINGASLYKKNLIRFLSKKSSSKYPLLKYFFEKDYKLLVPLYDYSGKKIVNIQFRRINPSKNNLPKAKFLPGGKVTDFGFEELNKHKGTIASFLVEGSTDYLSLKSLGYKNVLGLTNINSTFSSEEKIKVLKSLPKFIFMFYDNDEPGIQFMTQIKNQVKEIDPSKVFIPLNLLSKSKKIKDVNDFIVYTENPKEKINNSIIKVLTAIIKNEQTKDYIKNNLNILI